MRETVNPHWPDEVRLKMIEKSELYSEPRVYQYGFYDGFQHAQSQTQELIEQNRELIEALQNVANLLDSDSKISVESIKRVLTKYQKS